MNLDDDVITNASRIIILKLEEKGTIGIIVDEVKEVVTLCTDEIDKTSGSKDGKAMFINGVGKHGDELISLFEISCDCRRKKKMRNSIKVRPFLQGLTVFIMQKQMEKINDKVYVG